MDRKETVGYKNAIARNEFYQKTRAKRSADAKLRDAANRMVSQALASGVMTRKPCEICGATAAVEGHHEDYEKPLDVVWLCKTHHVQRHLEIRKQHGGGYNSKYKEIAVMPPKIKLRPEWWPKRGKVDI